MSLILVVYSAEPPFPASDQNPEAARYFVNPHWADVLGGAPSVEEIDAFLASASPPSLAHLNSGMLIRFSATNPIVVYENLGLAGVSRLAKGRYRITHVTPMPTDQYSVFPDVMDIVDKRVRYSARTVDYVEVRVVDATGVAADATEVSVKIERVIST